MLLSLEKQFLMIHVPKTGGTSAAKALDSWVVHPPTDKLNKVLCRMHLRKDPARFMLRVHGGLNYAHKVLPNGLPKSLFKFAFVRNPWDRLVSEYSFVVDREIHPRHKEVCKLGSFADYLKYEHERARGRSQVDMLKGPDGKLGMDFVGRFENLREDFAEACSRIGVDAALPHLNRTKHRDFRDYYDSQTRDYVAKHWHQEIQLFGYDF
ncbi:MAG: sulfotransferase family 2 domain-containing protein [Planctomycetes bacterium]|nr:sulfotransferase family 2 domain-containing protein [Planctomycetota bacterium]